MNMKQRIYEDYFKPSRLPEYRAVLELFRDTGYHMVGILDFLNLVKTGNITKKIFINRHDIDTSPNVAREMFEIEKDVYGHNGSSTFYFRDSTIDNKLILDIENYGYETGYHYEELATYEKRYKLKNIARIREALPECRKIFCEDVNRFRKETGSSSKTVASHGDFINVKYKILNLEILADQDIREQAGIVAEAYDEEITRHIKARYADQILLGSFSKEVKQGIAEHHDIIMTLTHPRNWKVDLTANTKDNFLRLWQGLHYKI